MQLSWGITKILRALSVTPFLIVIWHFLYPWIIHVLGGVTHDQRLSDHANNGLVDIFLLLFLTFWIYRYIDGFLSECELLGFSLVQMMLCATRWVFLGVLNLISPPFTSILMWYGLKQFTVVPYWLIALVSILLFCNSLHQGWLYPESKVSVIRYQTRFI